MMTRWRNSILVQSPPAHGLAILSMTAITRALVAALSIIAFIPILVVVQDTSLRVIAVRSHLPF
jgi:hypothetical protein